MTSLLLVHGGWLDKRCWDFVLPFLKARGIEAHTITLPGSGKSGVSAFRASMGLSAEAIGAKMREIGGPVALLGHSMGGYSISAAAERYPEMVAQMIYLSAWVPPQSGLSMAGMDRKHNAVITGPLVQKAISWKPWRGTINLDPAGGAAFLCPLASEEKRQFLFANATPQPIRPGFSKVAWSDARMGRIPKSYIECALDVAIPIGGQRHFQKNANFDKVVSIESDHCPFISAPEDLAATIAELMG